MSEPPTVTRSIDVAAPPAAVYALITDLDVLAELADETQAMTWKKGDTVAVGNVFAGRNANGRRRWTTTCTVTEAASGRAFEFDVVHPFPRIPVSRWRYEITETGTGVGCRVTESTWDMRPGWFRKPAELATGVRDRAAASARHIDATLARLKQRAELG